MGSAEPTDFCEVYFGTNRILGGARGNERRKNDFGIEKIEDPAE